MAQLEENAAAGERPPLAGGGLSALQEVVAASVYGAHRRAP